MTLGPSRLQLPHAFYTSMYLEVIAFLHYNNHDGVIHACVLKKLVFHQSTVNALASSNV